MNDSDLDRLLRSADATAPLPASFQHDVWRRIETADAGTIERRPFTLLEELLAALTRPVSVAMAVAVTVSTGLWLGTIQAVHSPIDAKVAYVTSVSPFAHSHESGMP